MEDIKEEGEDQRDERIVDIEAVVHRGGEVAYQRLDDAVQSDRLMRQRILRQADGSAVKDRRDRMAAAQRKMHGCEQGQLEVQKRREKARYVDLEKDRTERDDDKREGPQPPGFALPRRVE